MFKTTTKVFLFGFLFFSSQLFCMVYDNRYFPLIPKPHTRITDQPSWISVDPFFTTATKAYDDKENEKNIPSIFGKYNQSRLALAFYEIGLDNPMPGSFWNEENLFWKICQKIQSQGIAFSCEKTLFSPISIGFSCFLMHVTSRHDFFLKKQGALSEVGHIQELKESRRKMHEAMGITEAHSSRTGIGDFDLYIRAGNIWEYAYKCRRIDAGISLGFLMPSGTKKDVYSPTTVPFGGNGHWGMYLQGDAEFELREDMKLGLLMRGGTRFARTQCKRLSIKGEHPLYGALVAPVCVDPGMHFVFAPYFSMENLRGGLGFRIGLNLMTSARETWKDMRSEAEIDNVYSDVIEGSKNTGWTSEYISVNVFYDFGKTAVERGHKPILTLSWDIPRFIYIAENSLKTHRVSLGLEVNF